MNSRTTRSFREAFRALPLDVRDRARQAYHLWRDNPQLPGLRFKRVGDQVSVALVVNIAHLASGRTVQFIGIGSASMMNMIASLVD